MSEAKDLFELEDLDDTRQTAPTEAQYCGFSCGDKLDELQAICDEVIDFSKYNPEFAPVMLDKLAAVINETRSKLHENNKKIR
jgi:hypothetical protein